MKRRDLLKRTAALAAAGALAGCLSGGDDGGDGGDGAGAPDDGNAGGTATETPTETPTETETATPTPTETSTPTPEPTRVTASEVVEFGAECGGPGHDASVTFEDGIVRITGTMETPNPCHDAELKEADYDPVADELSVSVAAVPQDGICQQCVGSLSYEVAVEYEGPSPGTVAVVHAVGDETTTATTASN